MTLRRLLPLLVAGLVGLCACTGSVDRPEAADSAAPTPGEAPSFVAPSAATACSVAWRAGADGISLLLTTDGAAEVTITTRTSGGAAGPARTLSVLDGATDLPVELPTEEEVRELAATANDRACSVRRS